MSEAFAISPLDGRYKKRLNNLSKYFSEYALMFSRCRVELLYVRELCSRGIFDKLTTEEAHSIDGFINSYSIEDYNRIKEIESVTNHDVKACEIFLRERIDLHNNNIIHFGLTSEDINNLAYSLLIRDYIVEEHIPLIEELIRKLYKLCDKWKSIPFPSKTHGQSASPSTAGKETAVYINRLLNQLEKLKSIKLAGKLNGAVGTYSAMKSAFSDIDWLDVSTGFINKLGLMPNIATTQIEDHDSWAGYFNITRTINNIIIDMNVDFWLYISNDLFHEKTVEGEVGSSTMPHKVNPINFENSEGNMMLSNSLLAFLSDKLCRSRMQRDLSDSTVSRNIGTALSYSYLAIKETLRGLDKININEGRCRHILEGSPELLAEPIQTILKTAGIDDPYSLLKTVTRGKKVTSTDIDRLIEKLDISDNFKTRIKKLSPCEYTGDAERICDIILERVRKVINI